MINNIDLHKLLGRSDLHELLYGASDCEEDAPKLPFIKRPNKKKKRKGWSSYYKWWVSKQTYEIFLVKRLTENRSFFDSEKPGARYGQ